MTKLPEKTPKPWGSPPFMTMQIRAAVIAVFVLFGLGIFFGGYYTVDAGQVAVLLRFGAVADVTGPGFHLKIPFIESVRTVDTRITAIEWSTEHPMEAYSRDQQVAKLSVKVSLRALPDATSVRELYTRYRDLEGFESNVLVPRTQEAVKTVFGQFDAVRAIQERAKLNTEVDEAVRKLVSGPVSIEGVQIQDISFSKAYEESIEQRMQAQVEVEKVLQNKAREQLQADIRVIQANAEAQATKLRGQAVGEAIAARGKALHDNPQLVQLVAAEKWNGILPTTMIPGSTVPFISVPKD
jgi:regulator of protease activity HflC (stomatin/prohibitin superfamily)